MRLTSILVVLASSALSAQTLVTAPSSPTSNVNRPFGGGTGRYQQWYSASSLTSGFTTPVRIDQMAFMAGSTQSSNATMIDMEVAIGYGNALGLAGVFDQNFTEPPQIVAPRQNIQLAAGGPGTIVMTIPFTSQFTWDRTRSLVVDIRIFGNSRSNQPFAYNNLGTVAGILQTSRNYFAGNPAATTGQVQANIGMITQFRGRSGVILEYGTGCAGEGFHVPNNSVQNLPWPGITWSHQLDGASSQRLCMWMIGDSRTSFGTVFLPADVGTLLGMAPNGCMLRQNAVASLWATTVGGGPGTGIANVSVFMPAVTSYVGMSLYTQWFVLDPNAPNGLMSSSEAAWSIVAPVGG
ncbi:MAG: hypothetical protein KDC98_15575 [Planctomycetes bacterium]|nr:hypothetical protein [Planctomycetota bacterium]